MEPSQSTIKWTILLLSNEGDCYIKNQLKILYDNNDVNDFEVVVAEVLSPESKNRIDEYCDYYQNKYGNIKSVFLDFGRLDFNAKFALAIDRVKKESLGKYLLVQDGSFFWFCKNYLSYLEKYLLKGNVAVGINQHLDVKIGNSDFPYFAVCAYLKEKIIDIDFSIKRSTDLLEKYKKLFPEVLCYDNILDQGLKVRGILSLSNYYYFKEKHLIGFRITKAFISKCFGSLKSKIRCYFDGKNLIGVYLRNASYSTEEYFSYLNTQQQDLISKNLRRSRELYSNFFYKLSSFYIKKNNSDLFDIYPDYKSRSVLKICFNSIFRRNKDQKIGYSLFSFLVFLGYKIQNLLYTLKLLSFAVSEMPLTIIRSSFLTNRLASLSENKRKWTVGMVNYKTLPYIEHQLKILYEFNDPREFKLIIVDNSNPSQKKELEELLAPYSIYSNSEIIPHTPTYDKDLRGSLDHAEGLNIVLSRVDTPYFLVQDPDFFWIRKNYLKFFEQLIIKGFPVIGAPYPGRMRMGNRDFPAAFGCAFSTNIIKCNNLDFSIGRNLLEVSGQSKDVGWKIRSELSRYNYISFVQKVDDIAGKLGQYSYTMNSRKYFYNGEDIGYHMFRGSFTDNETNHKKASLDTMPPEAWNMVRKKYAKFFYLLAKGCNKNKIIKKINN